MDVAKRLREQNIAEYILYLWQIEDLLRALQFSPEAIYSQLIKPRSLDSETEEELLEWYTDICNLLEREDKESVGHLEHTIHLIEALENMHLQLFRLPIGLKYRELFAKLAPQMGSLREIVEKSERLEDEEIGDIELCFRALYAVMLYRIKGDKKEQGVSEDVIELVSPVIAELAKLHGQIERGEIDMFEGTGG